MTTSLVYVPDRAKCIVSRPVYVRYIASDTIADDPAKRLQGYRFSYDGRGNLILP